MNYKEKYEQALERAKDMLAYKEVRQEDMEYLFPELEENKDERIRKALIEGLRAMKSNFRTISSIKIDDAIAWLEKQGEQSVEPKWCHHKVDLSDCSEEYRKAYYDGWNNCNMQHSQRKAESNNEDERMRKEIIDFLRLPHPQFVGKRDHEKRIDWLEKQGDKIVDCKQNHQDVNYPNGAIVMEDFNGGEGFYKLHLDYLSKKQVEEVEEMVRTWNKETKTSNENIINCIGMYLTDANEQRFKVYDTNLKDCLAWLEKQCDNKECDDEWEVSAGLYKCTKRMFDGTSESRLLFETGNLYKCVKIHKCVTKNNVAVFESPYWQPVFLTDSMVRKHFIKV